MKFHQPEPSSLSTLDLNANVNIGRRPGDDISSSVLRAGELKSIGPRTVPCGTPDATSIFDDVIFSKSTV